MDLVILCAECVWLLVNSNDLLAEFRNSHHVFFSYAILQKREIGSYIPVHVSDSEDDSDSDGEADLTQNPETEAIKINLFDKNAFEPTPKPEVKVCNKYATKIT